MNFDEQQTRKESLDWYVHLAQIPAWKQYVWDRVKEIAKEHPVMHHDLPDRLVAAVKARQLDKAA